MYGCTLGPHGDYLHEFIQICTTCSFRGQTNVISIGHHTLPNLNGESIREWRNQKLFVCNAPFHKAVQ